MTISHAKKEIEKETEVAHHHDESRSITESPIYKLSDQVSKDAHSKICSCWVGSFLNAQGSTWDSDSFLDALARLTQLGLVQPFDKRSDGYYHVSLHPLISDWIILRSSKDTMAYSVIVAASLCAMLYSYNRNLKLDLNSQQQVLAHLDALSIHTVTLIDDQWPFFIHFLDSQNSASTVIGHFLYDYGHPRRAWKWFERAKNDYWENLGPDHHCTQNALEDLGLVLYTLGRYEEAGTCFRQVIDSRKRSERFHAKYDEGMLTSMGNLSITFNSLGRSEEAETLQREVLKSQEALLGRSDPSTMVTLTNLSKTLYWRRKYEEAEESYREALRLQKEVSGKDHPNTLFTMQGLGAVLWMRGNLDEAQRITKSALDMMIISLGQDHPRTLSCSYALGEILVTKGEYMEAEIILQQTLTRSRRVLGQNHPDTLTIMFAIGGLLKVQSMYEQALAIFRKVHELEQKVLGASHSFTITAMHILAQTLELLKEDIEAEEWYRKAVEGMEQNFGSKHHDTLVITYDLADLLFKTGQSKEARLLDEKCIQGAYEVFGPEHTYTMNWVANYKTRWQAMGETEAPAQFDSPHPLHMRSRCWVPSSFGHYDHYYDLK
jgi:tetratricopeptide (TPR) repeat protein